MACFALTRLHSSPTVTSSFTFLTSHCPIHCLHFLGYKKTKLYLVQTKSPWSQLLELHCVFVCYLLLLSCPGFNHVRLMAVLILCVPQTQKLNWSIVTALWWLIILCVVKNHILWCVWAELMMKLLIWWALLPVSTHTYLDETKKQS